MTILDELNKASIAEANEIIETAVGEIYKGFHRLRKVGLYQEEYDSMGALLNMLTADRMHLRKKYKVDP